MNGPPEVIYIIRHAEKPLKPPLSGLDFEGGQNQHSLLPRGWQRSGALAALFHPDSGPVRADLRTPTVLVAPSWGHPGKTAAHRSYQTIQGLSDRLEVPITCQFAQGEDEQFADSLVGTHSGIALICWEHKHIPVIASSLPVVAEPLFRASGRATATTSSGRSPSFPGRARPATSSVSFRSCCWPGDAAAVIPADADEPEGKVGKHGHHKG